jgi:tetratricopeptide (TPR) repeat protein
MLKSSLFKKPFMKSIILSVFFCAAVLTAVAQSDKYTAVMQKNIALLDSAKTINDLQSVAASFERIGDAEKTQWLPYYYAALAQTWVGWYPDVKDKDANAEKIKAYLNKAEVIEKNAELYAVENMVNTQQMLMDPQSRWQTNGQQAAAALQKGLQLDPNNPRLYYLQGESLFGTPTQFGGGKDKAKPVFEKAISLFKSAQPKPLYPTWGQKQAQDKLAQCQ